ILSALLAIMLLSTSITFTVNASTNEPTTKELEAIVKIVKPKLDVPEQCSKFSWDYNAKNAYNDASWHLTWETKDDAEKRERVQVNCDTKGNIINYTYRDYNKQYGQIPDFYKDDLEKVSNDFLFKIAPEIYNNVKLYDSYGSGVYSGQFTYNYVRYIDGYMFPENYVTVEVDYNTGKVISMYSDYDYELEIQKSDNIISSEKAEEILGTRQKMVLTYLTKTITDEVTKEKTIKAFLVYKPETSYLAVNAITGEIYDTKSEWSVNDKLQAGGAIFNGSIMTDSAESEEARKEYQLTDEELAGLSELEGLISKQDAIEAVTDNKYLYLNPALTAVSAYLQKNNNSAKTSTYQNDNGSYVWYISFSNPVIDNKYYSYAYADAAVNAQTGELISFNSNLNDYYYYSNNKLDIPDVKFSEEESLKIAEEFLDTYFPEKIKNTVKSSYNNENVIYRSEENGEFIENRYGAHRFGYTRVNEGVKFTNNNLSIGVDGVTGKIYSYNCNWWTNVEFESPEGAISPTEALSYLLSENKGYGVVYERNITYLYTPVTENSKIDVCLAFVASLMKTLETGGDIDKIIDKYAKNINREKLIDIIKANNEDEILDFVFAHFGITSEEADKTANEYVDTSLFYDKETSARLVYKLYDADSEYVSPFTGKLLTGRGEEYIEESDTFTYSDLEGHWIEKDAMLLADIGIGFDSGVFNPDSPITEMEYAQLSQSMSFYIPGNENEVTLTRIDAIKSVINSLGYEKIANIKGIYKTNFLDSEEIKEEDTGYIAIASGLGIIKGDGANINAYSYLTRAQAVSLLLNAIRATR
ncbi:MAG: hypothetical protein IKI97_13260, partial [Clostridia bacterium]|nr:hypothetical protein [Clostridia bacterium]